MGCQQSWIASPLIDETSSVSLKKHASSTGGGSGAPLSKVVDINYVPPPVLLDANGRLLPEEVTRRTETSGTDSKIVLLGKEHEIQVEYAYCSQRGYYPGEPYKENQDTVDVVEWLACSTIHHREAWFAVCDGHGPQGGACSRYAKKKLSTLLANHVRQARAKKLEEEESSAFVEERMQRLSEQGGGGQEEQIGDSGCVSSEIDKRLQEEQVQEDILTKKKKSIKLADDPNPWPQNHHLDHLNNKEYEACIRKAFLETNQAMHRSFMVDDSYSGTTAIAVVFHGPIVTIANCGDSRAILGHAVVSSPAASAEQPEPEEPPPENCVNLDPESSHPFPSKNTNTSTNNAEMERIVALPLSLDQTPYRLDERERVKKAGASVMSAEQVEGRVPYHDNWGNRLLGDTFVTLEDPPRLWARGTGYPGAAFTRSIGDAFAEEIGVIAEPEMLSLELTCQDRILVIASDGVFEFLTNQQVIDLCVENHQSPLYASKAVVKAAYEEWIKRESCTDDISVIVCFLTCARPQMDGEKGTTEELLAVTRELPEWQANATDADGDSSSRRELFARGHSMYGNQTNDENNGVTPGDTSVTSLLSSNSDTEEELSC